MRYRYSHFSESLFAPLHVFGPVFYIILCYSRYRWFYPYEGSFHVYLFPRPLAIAVKPPSPSWHQHWVAVIPCVCGCVRGGVLPVCYCFRGSKWTGPDYANSQYFFTRFSQIRYFIEFCIIALSRFQLANRYYRERKQECPPLHNM